MTATKTAKGVGRPRAFDLDSAVDTAVRLFHACGYDRVGVAELSAALGIKPPSFYAAFGNKAALFERALATYSSGPANVFATAIDAGGDVRTVIARTFDNAAKCYAAKDGMAGCLVLDASRNSGDPQVQAIGGQARAAAHAGIAAFIASERPDRADDLARFVMIALAGMSATARDGLSRDDLTAFAKQASRAFAVEMAST